MKVVIIEDEHLSAEKLERYLQKFDEGIEVVTTLGSIEESVQWFQNLRNTYDVVFMDIQLTDGLSFEIFHRVAIDKPVIFTTAFDEFAIDAFKVNSIDYILKPITFTDLHKAMSKLKSMHTIFNPKKITESIDQIIAQEKLKDRFLVKLGNHIHSIRTEEVSLFYAEGRTVYLVTNQSKKFIIDYKLEDLVGVLKIEEFFRVNRSFIININAIQDVLVFSSSRLKITPKTRVEKDIIVSREKVTSFKKWFEGN